jgi:hypothetical protein
MRLLLKYILYTAQNLEYRLLLSLKNKNKL